MWNEFKTFLLKTNAFALAIGVIIGAATGKVVSAIVADLLMPIISLLIPSGSWREAQLGKDEGKYGFRQWQTQLMLPAPGAYSLFICCTNSNGVAQPDTPNWNPAGFMRNVMESIDVIAV